jgi:hypothetical protein
VLGTACGLAALALLFRLPWLWRLGLHGDEDISTLAAEGIAASGLPLLPSGHLYGRGLLFHYLAAPLTLLGQDWLPRLVSVTASCAAAAVLFLLVRRLVDRRVAVVASALFAVSLLEIHLARQVRMYALYQLLALLALWLIYRAWERGRLPDLLLAAGAVLLAMGSHSLAATLGLLFPLVALSARDLPTRIGALLAAPLFGALALLQRRWLMSAMWAGQVRERSAPVESSEPAVFGADPFAFGQSLVGGPGFTLVGLALAVLGAGAVLALLGGDRRRFAPWAAAAAAGLVCAGAGWHQIGLALIGLAVLVLLRAELLPGRGGARALVALALLVGAASAAWLLAALLTGHGPAESAIGLFGRSLGRLLRHLLLWPPVLSAAAALGALIVLVRAWRERGGLGERFLLLALLLLTAGRAMLASKWLARYLSDVWPLWESLAALAAVSTVAAAARLAGPRRALGHAAALAVAVLLLLGPGLNPVGTLAYLRWDHGAAPASAGSAAGFVPDLRGATAWLEARLGAGERVVATDWLTTYYYLGRLDGWIRTGGYRRQSFERDGALRDIYLGTEVLTGPDELRSFLSRGPTWVVVGGSEWRDQAKLSGEIRDWLEADEPVYLSGDGRTRIHRFDPADPPP